jgi:hypothetical protein
MKSVSKVRSPIGICEISYLGCYLAIRPPGGGHTRTFFADTCGGCSVLLSTYPNYVLALSQRLLSY